MSYPYVQSAVDLGPAKGPRRAMCWHMAEGGGTVGYLSRPNPNNVSVHFVVERTGRIVQMLPLDHMHTSIRASDIRTGNDAPYTFGGVSVTYGATAARTALGDWATTAKTLGPNHATLGVEVEGFAADGPNANQTSAIAALYADMAARHPGLFNLAHRDFADYKACPGRRFPWAQLGGHASAPEGPDMLVVNTVNPYPDGARTWRVAAGVTLRGYDPARPGVVVKSQAFTAPSSALCDAECFVAYPGTTTPPAPNGGPFLRVTNGTFSGLLIVKSVVTVDGPPPAPAPDCTAAVAAATAPLKTEITELNAKIDAAQAALA